MTVCANRVALLTARPRNEIAADEFAVIARVAQSSLQATQASLQAPQPSLIVEQIFLEDAPQLDLQRYSAFIISGSPYNFSTPLAKQTLAQRKTEAVLEKFVQAALARDLPTLGICYGLQAITVHAGRGTDSRWGEEISAPTISLTDAGQSDPLFGQLPPEFRVFTGHSECADAVPDGGVLLATSSTCPIQAMRFGANVYCVQFHPEITAPSLELRISLYDGKYFPAGMAQRIRANTSGVDVSAGEHLIAAFFERYCMEVCV